MAEFSNTPVTGSAIEEEAPDVLEERLTNPAVEDVLGEVSSEIESSLASFENQLAQFDGKGSLSMSVDGSTIANLKRGPTVRDTYNRLAPGTSEDAMAKARTQSWNRERPDAVSRHEGPENETEELEPRADEEPMASEEPLAVENPDAVSQDLIEADGLDTKLTEREALETDIEIEEAIETPLGRDLDTAIEQPEATALEAGTDMSNDIDLPDGIEFAAAQVRELQEPLEVEPFAIELDPAINQDLDLPDGIEFAPAQDRAFEDPLATDLSALEIDLPPREEVAPVRSREALSISPNRDPELERHQPRGKYSMSLGPIDNLPPGIRAWRELQEKRDEF